MESAERVRYNTPPSVPLALTEAFHHAIETGDASDVRALAAEFVRALRRVDMAPEQALIALKAALPNPRIDGAGSGTNASSDAISRLPRERALFDGIVSHCIGEYYRDTYRDQATG
ncbi:MAG TPA: hypothetical protein VH277_09535 [Gemmatimonadaceae bacterium]|jgi:hypothetical protein|nr:hypothetical protein [Gemmatimonadaceae bacterium]